MAVFEPPGGRELSEILGELQAMNVEVDHEVMRIGPRTWALHGLIAYDGEVIVATFSSENDAWAALSASREYRGAVPRSLTRFR